jgi:AraC-like DNA-binding protein
MPDWLSNVPSPDFPQTPEPLVFLAGAGHEIRTGPHYFHDAATRRDSPHLVLQYTLRGTGFYHRQGQPRILLPRGTAFLDSIPGPFTYGWHAGDYEQVFLSLRGPPAERWLADLHADHGPVLTFPDDRAIPDAILLLLEQSRQSLLRDRYLVSAQLYGLMMLVRSRLSRSRLLASDLADRARASIESSANDPRFNITHLARRLDCSREHLAREFRRALAVSPLDYLTRHRVRLAAAELRTSRRKLDAIARRCGFASAAYFCRRFRAAVGVTPGQFRRQPWLTIP